MIPRYAQKKIENALREQAAVALMGPRQVGKTTLALYIGHQVPSLYLDLQDRDDRARLLHPSLFLENLEDKLVILDEIHHAPDLFQALRGIIDKGRRKQKGIGRFLILGSASIEILRQSSESLAGRITYIDMTPLVAHEINHNRTERDHLWLRGGFPDSYLSSTDRTSLSWRKNFIRTYLERDIPMFGPRIPSETMERLWIMLAHRQGSIFNASELARALQISTQSVNRYIDLLVDLMLVRRLPPYGINIHKRLVKSQKIYIRDSGLVHALLNIETLDRLEGHPVVGMSWEGFALETLLSVLPWGVSAFFYRTAVGAEIDLILEHPDGTVWTIEIKRGLSGKVGRGFYSAFEDIKPAKAFVVHAGDDRYPMSQELEAISLVEMTQEILSLS